MKRVFKIIWILFVFILISCAVHPPEKIERIEPVIRVGLMWGREVVEFSVQGPFQITSHDGTFIAKGMKGDRWSARIIDSVPGQVIYILVASSMRTEERARMKEEEIRKLGFETFIQPVGRQLCIGNRVINDSRSYRVCLRETFESERAAEAFKDSIWGKLETFVAQKEVQKAKGTILIENLGDGQKFESTKPIFIRGLAVTLYDVPVGTGFHFERVETRTYPEVIDFQFDNDGKLAVINIVPLECYLQGVVPSEMSDDFPSEALKAQAVVARGEVLAKLGFVHLSDPFDICATVHCQSYSGLTKRTQSTDRAVKETRGLVLWKDGRICETVYSSVCGGHGEDNDKAWNGESRSYLQGGFDGPKWLQRYGPLFEEEKVKKWIDGNPHVYCNTTLGSIPKAFDYTKKYFRWKVRYTQEEIREILQEKIEWERGNILDMIPLERGVSGRILRLKILGSEGEIIVEGELAIRKALSRKALWSSCFYVDKEEGEPGSPSVFVIKGAGFGHGVGMCQTGAAVMALIGKHFDGILRHYFNGARIKRLY